MISPYGTIGYGNKDELKQMDKREIQAYMTIEASLLIPMVVCVIVVIIYTAFCLYDKCLIAQDSYILCLRESYRKDAEGPQVNTEAIESGAERQFGTKYFAVNAFSGNAAAEGTIGSYCGTMKVAPGVFGQYFLMPQNIWTQRFSSAARKTDPPWSIRSYRRKTYVIRKGVHYLSDSINGEKP